MDLATFALEYCQYTVLPAQLSYLPTASESEEAETDNNAMEGKSRLISLFVDGISITAWSFFCSICGKIPSMVLTYRSAIRANDVAPSDLADRHCNPVLERPCWPAWALSTKHYSAMITSPTSIRGQWKELLTHWHSLVSWILELHRRMLLGIAEPSCNVFCVVFRSSDACFWSGLYVADAWPLGQLGGAVAVPYVVADRLLRRKSRFATVASIGSSFRRVRGIFTIYLQTLFTNCAPL